MHGIQERDFTGLFVCKGGAQPYHDPVAFQALGLPTLIHILQYHHIEHLNVLRAGLSGMNLGKGLYPIVGPSNVNYNL